jgi:hypothetical protein
MSKDFRESTALGISALGWIFAFLSFIPIFVLQTRSSEQQQVLQGAIAASNTTSFNSSSISDDYYYYINGFDGQPIVREATISAIMISIPLAMDVLLDMLPAWVNVLVFAESRQLSGLPVRKSDRTLFHLTTLEKISFIVGTVCLSALSFQPVRSYGTPAILNLSFLNANTCLVTCPILAFLTRCAPTWTPIISVSIAGLICVGAALSSFSNLPVPSEAVKAEIFLASETIVTIAFSLYILVCVISAVNTFWFHVPYPDDVQQAAGKSTVNATSDSNSKENSRRVATDRFRNCVIASHMATTLVIAIVNPVWFFETGHLSSVDYTVIIYTLVVASAIVYVTEFRVRKSEVTNALVSRIFMVDFNLYELYLFRPLDP